MAEKQVTSGPGGRILTNINCWSPDAEWLVYDTRSDPEGTVFDGAHIERVRVATGEVQRLYSARNGAHCGVVTYHPSQNKVVFIHGPEDPTPDWSYGQSHRQGVIVAVDTPGVALPLDARDLTAPGTPGALRGGSHVHVWHPKGDWLSYTYNDALTQPSLREVGVCFPRPVSVPKTHPRNHDGTHFSFLATHSVAQPQPGSREYRRAFEEGWIGTSRELAFLGETLRSDGTPQVELYVTDGLESQRPTVRLLHTVSHGIVTAPRHWVRSLPDGSLLLFLIRDTAGNAQLASISPKGTLFRQRTHHPFSITSALGVHPSGERVGYIADGSVFLLDLTTGKTHRATPRTPDTPLPLACVFSPNGKQLAYLRTVQGSNQLCVLDL